MSRRKQTHNTMPTHKKKETRGRPRKYQPGHKWNSLTLIDYDPNRRDSRNMLVRCDCGEVRSVKLWNLTSGHTKTCGDWNNHPHHKTKTL